VRNIEVAVNDLNFVNTFRHCVEASSTWPTYSNICLLFSSDAGHTGFMLREVSPHLYYRQQSLGFCSQLGSGLLQDGITGVFSRSSNDPWLSTNEFTCPDALCGAGCWSDSGGSYGCGGDTWGSGALGGGFQTSLVPADVIVVLTHGMQPGGFTGLPQIKSAVAESWLRSTNEQQLAILEHVWTGAIVPSIPWAAFHYDSARRHAYDEGYRLAAKINDYVELIREQVDPQYQPRIHMIGHSLGTVVNAEAVQYLDSGINVEQFTILDAPLAPGNDQYCHERFFYERLRTSRVQRVDNYIATTGLRFGQPIDGAGPSDGGARLQTDHFAIVDLYAQYVLGPRTIAGNPWISPLVNNSTVLPRWRTGVACEVEYRPITEGPLDVAYGNVVPLSDSSYELTTASPAGVGKSNFLIEPGMQEFEFEFQTLAGDGTLLVRFGTQVLWQRSLNELALTSGRGNAMLGHRTGETANLVIELQPASPTTSTSAAVSNIRVSVRRPSCDSLDFNQNSLFPEDADLIDFLSVLAGGPCSPGNTCNDIDFNNDGLFPADDDLLAFLRVLAGGSC
jgi:hypothetical protein